MQLATSFSQQACLFTLPAAALREVQRCKGDVGLCGEAGSRAAGTGHFHPVALRARSALSFFLNLGSDTPSSALDSANAGQGGRSDDAARQDLKMHTRARCGIAFNDRQTATATTETPLAAANENATQDVRSRAAKRGEQAREVGVGGSGATSVRHRVGKMCQQASFAALGRFLSTRSQLTSSSSPGVPRPLPWTLLVRASLVR